ncbi:low-complexity tail membrane protein [Synechococcus sp. MU1650]|nr:low-complexity tail membrane protein [Synechococcus sp. MU1650]
MQPRSEPLLWLQCLALGAIPLELLVIRLVLAGADPGPVPGVERFLIWGVGVLAPTVALWRRPADWGSLLLVRQPLASRSSDQLRISASQSGLSSRIAVVAAAVILLPTLWWLDDSAVLVNEFSPVSGQSRLVSLLLVSPLLALIVWQLQQLVQAAAVLVGSATTIAAADSTFRAEAVATQRTSLGLQLLNLPALDWPEAQADPSTEGIVEEADVDAPAVAEDSQDQDKSETDPSNNEIPDETIDAKPAEPETDDGTENETTVQDSTDINRGMPEVSVETEANDTDQAVEVADVDASASDGVNRDIDASETEIDQPKTEIPDETIDAAPAEPDTDDGAENKSTEQESKDNIAKMSVESADIEPEELVLNNEAKEVSTESELDVDSAEDAVEAEVDAAENTKPSASPESVVTASAPVPVEPEQPGEEEESTALNPEISQVDTVASGSTEGHGEQAEPSGGKESEPEQSSEPPPGSL